jgi:hypothetical protein
MTIQKQIKEVLINIALKDELPMDMTQLDESIFDEVINPLIQTLKILRTDAEMALDGRWDCTTQEGIETGFSAQIEIIENVLNN